MQTDSDMLVNATSTLELLVYTDDRLWHTTYLIPLSCKFGVHIRPSIGCGSQSANKENSDLNSSSKRNL